MELAILPKKKKVTKPDSSNQFLKNDKEVVLKITAINASYSQISPERSPQPPQMFFGLEFSGIIEETGSAVNNLKFGDSVVVTFPAYSEPSINGDKGADLTERSGPLKKMLVTVFSLVQKILT